MRVLPGQKLTIGELFVSMAIGLILYLLPGDLRNQTTSVYLSEALVFLSSFVITLVFMLIIKRYEAVGAALLTDSVITVGAFSFGVARGFFTKGGEFWPVITEYQLVTMFILWVVPFFIATIRRLLSHDAGDTEEKRLGFCRFLTLSLRALLLLYLMVLLFRQILPVTPNTMAQARDIGYIPFEKIGQCFQTFGDGGALYLLWNGLILAPLSFTLLIFNPRIRWWHILFISFAMGLTLEVLQFSFNTGRVHVDDLILYLIGGMLGMFLKHLIDRLRSFITAGEEKIMLTLDFLSDDPPAEIIVYHTGNDDDESEAGNMSRPEKEFLMPEENDDFDSDFSDTAEIPALVPPELAAITDDE